MLEVVRRGRGMQERHEYRVKARLFESPLLAGLWRPIGPLNSRSGVFVGQEPVLVLSAVATNQRSLGRNLSSLTSTVYQAGGRQSSIYCACKALTHRDTV